MTDDDLIKQLRNSKGWPTLGNAAADRIEALIAERGRAEALEVERDAEKARGDALAESLARVEANLAALVEDNDALAEQNKNLGDMVHQRGNTIASLRRDLKKAKIERDALAEKLERAVEEKLWAIDTLNAWFDRRKLGHEAVDQAVIDAASGYLRTSRVGGMPQEESDLILGVIQDMARLGLFADLFARAALAAIQGDNTDD